MCFNLKHKWKYSILNTNLNETIEIVENKSDSISKSAKCVVCKRRATFGTKESKSKSHCYRCANETMIRINSYMCIENGCIIFPTFNYKNSERGKYCEKHKKDCMIDVVNRKCLSCDKIPCFNYNKGEIMYDLINKYEYVLIEIKSFFKDRVEF